MRSRSTTKPTTGFPGKPLRVLLEKLESDSREIDVSNPTNSDIGARADLMSAAAALPNDDIYSSLWLEAAIGDVFGCTSKDMSYLQLLCSAHGVDLDLMSEVRLTGVQAMCKAMASAVIKAGGAVHGSTRVQSISQVQTSGDKATTAGSSAPPAGLGRRPSVPSREPPASKEYPVRVVAEAPRGVRHTVSAKYVVLAVPLYALRNIHFTPPLPASRAVPISREFICF